MSHTTDLFMNASRPVAIELTSDTASPANRVARRRSLAAWAPGAGGTALILALCALVLIVRRPDALFTAQFWAEDCAVYFKDSIELGVAALVVPYAGYFTLVQRLVALVASPVPAAFAPLAFNVLALATALLVILRVLSRRLELPYRALLALAIVLVPHTGEVFLTATNLQWITALAMVAVVFSRAPQTLVAWIVDVAWLVVAGLSGPFVIFIVPLVIIRMVREGSTRHRVVILSIAVGCALLHALALATSGAPPASTATVGSLAQRAGIAAAIFVIKGPGIMFMGGALPYAVPYPLAGALAAALGALALVTLFARRDARERWITASLLLFGAMIAVATAIKFFQNPRQLLEFDHGDRYFFIARVMVAWSLILALESSARRRTLAMVLLAASAVGSLSAFRWPAPRDFNWRATAAALDRGEPARVTVPPDWEVTITPRSFHAEDGRR
jgi:hypothetical protein